MLFSINYQNREKIGIMEISFLEAVQIKTILSNIGGFTKSLGILFGGLILFILRRAIRNELELSCPNHKQLMSYKNQFAMMK